MIRTPRVESRRGAVTASHASGRPRPGIRSFLPMASLVACIASAPPVGAQSGARAPEQPEKLVRASAEAVQMKAGSRAEAVVRLAIEPGWHINANPPSPDYMIPTSVELKGPRGLNAGKPIYPSPKLLKVEFDDAALFVYDGTVTVRVPLTASVMTPAGTHTLDGKVRFQACNDELCLAPVAASFNLEVTVEAAATAPRDPTPEGAVAEPGARAPPDAAIDGGEADAGAAPHGAAGGDSLAGEPDGGQEGADGDAFARGPDKDGGAFAGGAGTSALLDNPIARKLAGGTWSAFATLFLIGLALNLTPCVYPMLGVTVSIFGARRSERPLQAAGYAVIYVLGMALMYSALGLIAAFTGGLFGGLLQSPIVLIVIGGLLLALALSMFGLYELQLPPAITSRLGGTGATSAAGVFLSGLVVGVFAAPCIGPPIVALLALVGAKGDPWFGFTSFFTLAMGLGAPYLVLGTFSNLLQRMPRSGDWMVWVKKVFGVVLVAIGLFYVLLAVGPALTAWVAPIALLVGGLFLGFFERSGEKRAGFRWLKRATGAAGIVAGVVMVVTAPRESIVFEDFTPAVLQAALEAGTPVMVDFTADWCAPCHELERFTFTDGKVREAARGFRALRVDLTRYDSPESEQYRREYKITGVPTVLFIAPDGREIMQARVEGFMPPQPFLERMQYAAGQVAAAVR